MSITSSNRVTSFRRKQKQQGCSRIELRLGAAAIDALDYMVHEERMTRSQYIAALIEQDFEDYHKQE